MAGRRIRRAAISATVLIISAMLLFWLEPLAPRHEGKTARQWLQAFAVRERIDQPVITALGTNAIPVLIKTIRDGQRDALVRYVCEETLEKITRRDLTLSFQTVNEKRMLAAGTWLSWLAARDSTITNLNLSQIGLWLDAHDDSFFAPRWVQLILTTPHESAAERAKLPSQSDP